MLTKATTVLYLPCTHLENFVSWFLQIPVGHCKQNEFFKADIKKALAGEAEHYSYKTSINSTKYLRT